MQLYCIAAGVKDSVEVHFILSEFLNLLEKQRISFEKNQEQFETEAMRLFLESGILHPKKSKSNELPEIEPSRMIPNPVDFGALGELAEPKEKLEPLAVVLSVVFWGIVYAFLLYGLLR